MSNAVAVIADVAGNVAQQAIDDQSIDINEVVDVAYDAIVDQIPNEIPCKCFLFLKVLNYRMVYVPSNCSSSLYSID